MCSEGGKHFCHILCCMQSYIIIYVHVFLFLLKTALYRPPICSSTHYSFPAWGRAEAWNCSAAGDAFCLFLYIHLSVFLFLVFGKRAYHGQSAISLWLWAQCWRLGLHVFLCWERLLTTSAILRNQVSLSLFSMCVLVCYLFKSYFSLKRFLILQGSNLLS